MINCTVDEFLAILDESKGTIFLSITTEHLKMPGEGGLNKFKRGTRGKDAIPCPFTKGIVHYLRQQVIVGASYENMVNTQRDREATAYLQSLPLAPSFLSMTPEVEPFIAEQLWKGKGQRDQRYPRFVAYHTEKLERYLVFRPHSTDESGKPTPIVNDYHDADTGRKLDFKADLADYYRASGESSYGSNVQGTEKLIPWQTVKLSNIASARHKKEEYLISRD